MATVDIQIGEHRFVGRTLGSQSPNGVAALMSSVPLAGDLLQEEWSGGIVRSEHPVIDPAGLRDLDDESYPYQYPGLLVVEPDSGHVALCYGQGRLQDAYGPRKAVPVAEVVQDLTAFNRSCEQVQFNGRTVVKVSPRDEAAGDDADAAVEGRRFTISLGDTQVTARLLEDVAPGLTEALAAAIPATGRGTNTHSSGPLLRFWNDAGGTQGMTRLDSPPEELDKAQVILYPGYVYYLPKPGFAGLRIATRRATLMRSSTGNGALKLVPVAQLEGNLEPFRDEAATLRVAGAKPMALSF